MTARQIEEVLLLIPAEERFGVAALLIALALADDELLEDTREQVPDDRELLMAHLRGKLGHAA